MKYSFVTGIPELKEKIIERFNKIKKVSYNKSNIIVSNGSKQSLYNIFQTICNKDDEVIILSPYWVTFPESVKLSEAKPIFIKPNNNLSINLKEVERSINNKTKAIIVNNPNNPSGKIVSQKEIDFIASLAKKHNLWVIADEAYETLTYDEKHLPNFYNSPENIHNQIICVQSFSKSFCLTGFRVGYTVANSSLISQLSKLQSHITGNNCTFAQYGALEALNMDQTFFKEMKETFKKRRDLAFSLFSEIFDLEKPEGAFYLFPSIKKYEKKI